MGQDGGAGIGLGIGSEIGGGAAWALDAGPLWLAAALALAALAIALVAVVALRRQAPVHRRLRAERGGTATSGAVVAAAGIRAGSLPSPMAARLRRAGVVTPQAVRVFWIVQAATAAGALSTASALMWSGFLYGLAPSLSGAAAAAVLAAGFGAPTAWLRRCRARRARAVRNALPDALDMMVVCLEAGLGLDATLSRVAAHIAPAHPLLAAELSQVALELRAGKSRAAAMRALAARLDVHELDAVVTLIVQSQGLGVGIADALRVHAGEVRAARLLRAEEIAHALPVKLTVPLVVCVLPAMLAVVLLPSIVSIVRDVLPNLAR